MKLRSGAADDLNGAKTVMHFIPAINITDDALNIVMHNTVKRVSATSSCDRPVKRVTSLLNVFAVCM